MAREIRGDGYIQSVAVILNAVGSSEVTESSRMRASAEKRHEFARARTHTHTHVRTYIYIYMKCEFKQENV